MNITNEQIKAAAKKYPSAVTRGWQVNALLDEISRLERVGIQVPESVGVLAKRTAEEHAALLSDRAALVEALEDCAIEIETIANVAPDLLRQRDALAEALREIAAMYPRGVVGHQASDKARAALNAAAEPAKEKRFNYPLAPKRAHSMDDGTPLPD